MRTPTLRISRPAARALALALLMILAACGDDGPAASDPQPTGFQISVPDTVLAGTPFDVTVVAVGADGSAPAADVSGPVTISISAGTIIPGTLTLVAGQVQARVTVSDLTGPQILGVSRASASESVELLVIGQEPVARVEVVPGAFLFTEAGETRQLAARAYDAEGWQTQAQFSWASSDPGAIAVDPSGLASAAGTIGSSLVTAQAEGVVSPPVVALTATPVPGAVLVDDEQVARTQPLQSLARANSVAGETQQASEDYAIFPVDPNAEYGLGWQYRVNLTGAEAPAVGSILLGTGDAPIAGKVVSTATEPNGVVVTLEVVELVDVFQDFRFQEAIPLQASEFVLSDDVVAEYESRWSGDGFLELTPRTSVLPSPSGDLPPIAAQTLPSEFSLGPFRCKAQFLGSPLQFRTVPVIRVRPSLSVDYDYVTGVGLRKANVVGSVRFDLKLDPKAVGRLEQTLDCNVQIGAIPLPIGGPASFFLGGNVPIGGGFELKATTTLAEFGTVLTVQAEKTAVAGLDCTSGSCAVEAEVLPASFDWAARPEWPQDLGDQFRFDTQVFPYVYGGLAVGPRFLMRGLELLQLRLGAYELTSITTEEIQAQNDAYAASFHSGLQWVLKAGSGIEKALKLLGATVVKLETRGQVVLASSPAGQFTIAPTTVKAGTLQEPGDTAVFAVALDPVTYWGLASVDAVRILWEKDDGFGGIRLEDLPGSCSRMVSAADQRTFTCKASFRETDVGQQTFYAFVEAKEFGISFPVPLEVAKNGKATVQVDPPTPTIVVDPVWNLVVPSGGWAQFTERVYGLEDRSVTWSVEPAPVMGSIDQNGRYTSPTLQPGQAVMNVVRATSVEDPQVFGRAAVNVAQPRINPRDPNEGGCRPSENQECSGEGSSWGDPHLVTPDDRKYDFMAVGDFVLTKSTAPDDDFEIHSRYGRPPEDKEFSWNNAVAMRVEGDVVELYAASLGVIDIVVNGEDVTLAVDESLELDGGGAISRTLGFLTVSWPDRTQVEVAASGVPGVLSYVRTSLPSARYGQVEGLLGNFDGDPDNDIRIRNGAVLTDPTPVELYSTYRQSWWVPFGTEASLFTRGVEQFDANFPPRVISVFDLPGDEVIQASQVCVDAGVLDSDILNACILDVVLTGDDRWAAVAAGMDPNTPGIKISPSVAYLQQGDARQFGAILTGTADRRVQWTATGGTIQVDGDNIMTYTAPDQTGEYTLTATSVADGSLVATAEVFVSEVTTGYTKEWTGEVDGEWVNAYNWLPAGEPDSTDNVYIPSGTRNPLYLRWSNRKVNNLLVEEGGSTGGAAALIVRGNAVVRAPLDIIMTGGGKTVTGTIPLLRVQGTVSPGGPLEVGRLFLDGGTFAPNRHRVDVRESLQSYAETGGRLVMNHPEDHVYVGGDVSFYRLTSGSGSLTAGTLEVTGRLLMQDGTVQFISSGTHRVVMSGTEVQTIDLRWGYVGGNNEPPTNRVFNELEFANPAGVFIGQKAVQVNGLITVRSGTVNGVSVHLLGGLEDLVGGWRVPLVVRDPGVSLPAQLQAKLTLAGGDFGVDYTPAADLTVTGAVEVWTGSILRIGTRTLTVNGTLTTVGDGKVTLADDAGRLVVNGNALFGQGAAVDAVAGALFSAGRFEITGNLGENLNRFRASGTHVTAFTGTTAQTVSMSCYYNNCAPYNAAAASPLQEIEVSNPAGVTFQGRTMGIAGDFTVLQGGLAIIDQAVRLDGSLDLAGTLTVNAGKTLAVIDALLLRATGTLNNNGTMTVTSCTKEDGGTITGTDPCG